MVGQQPAEIPVFNLDDELQADDIRQACLAAGCFNVQGGGLEGNATRELLNGMSGFFDLPDDHPVKTAVHRNRNAGANGWSPMLDEPSYEAGTVAWVESFDCVLSRAQIDGLPGSLRHTIRPSIWPAIGGFREAVRAHWDILISAAHRVFPLISGMLGQEPDFLARHASTQALNTMRLLNYPARPETADGISRGISAHTDFECITLIHQDAPGLEIRTPAGAWRQVPVRTGQWTVLLGDMVERWSNGVYRATPHRVPTTGWPRRSIVMFMAVDAGVEIAPLENFVSSSNPAQFVPVTQDQAIRTAMAMAEQNRAAMLPEVEKLKAGISPG